MLDSRPYNSPGAQIFIIQMHQTFSDKPQSHEFLNNLIFFFLSSSFKLQKYKQAKVSNIFLLMREIIGLPPKTVQAYFEAAPHNSFIKTDLILTNLTKKVKILDFHKRSL